MTRRFGIAGATGAGSAGGGTDRQRLREAIDLVIELVERIGAVFVVTPDAKGFISPRHPSYRGVFGFAGHTSADAAMGDKGVDLILAVGTDMGEFTSNGWDESLLNNRLVHIDSCEMHLTRSPMARLHVRGRVRLVLERVLRTLRKDGTKEISVGEKRRFRNISVDEPFKSASAGAPTAAVFDARAWLAQSARHAFPWSTPAIASHGRSIIWGCTTTKPVQAAGCG
jgi:acetolactate synthase-1/2/3 large subunit